MILYMGNMGRIPKVNSSASILNWRTCFLRRTLNSMAISSIAKLAKLLENGIKPQFKIIKTISFHAMDVKFKKQWLKLKKSTTKVEACHLVSS